MEAAAVVILQFVGPTEWQTPGNKSSLMAKILLSPILPTNLKLFYGHLDVLPEALRVGWDGEPFTMVERTGMLYGRGSTSSDQGCLLGKQLCVTGGPMGTGMACRVHIHEGMMGPLVLMGRLVDSKGKRLICSISNAVTLPSLSFNGLKDFSGSGAKPVIPRKAISKFLVKWCSDMIPKAVCEQIIIYQEDC
ncbi:hypothetical protein E2I00_007102 [Balaenoptera physalus]|uniref:Uncharacterized protein n=1 Tax=Balaenoptera physalus TaxID=9770 RepID=A0A6A1QHE7_BALPH|nr:hypothetical protein E2I00_007102 [Balaenoptera physalus]